MEDCDPQIPNKILLEGSSYLWIQKFQKLHSINFLKTWIQDEQGNWQKRI
jgi:hypothetical protein